MTARRAPLAELDALTDQIEPLLARLDATWRRVEAELRAPRTPISAGTSSGAGTRRVAGLGGTTGRPSGGTRVQVSPARQPEVRIPAPVRCGGGATNRQSGDPSRLADGSALLDFMGRPVGRGDVLASSRTRLRTPEFEHRRALPRPALP